MRGKRWIYVYPVILIIGLFLLGFLNSKKVPVEYEDISNQGFGPIYIPDSVFFADKLIPVNYFDVFESLEREILVNANFHSQTIRFIKLAPRYFAVIEPILREYGIPDDFKYLAVAESNLSPKAVSPAKAVGMWQFLAGTARDYGLEVTKEVDERYNVEKSTVAACKYLLEAFEKYQDWTLVAASYNGGMKFLTDQMGKQKVDSYFDLLLGDETERYLFRIVALKLVLEKPEQYGFYIPEEEKYPVLETRNVEIDAPVADFADFALKNGTNYKILKYFNPWLREGYLSNPNAKKYVVKIPVENGRDYPQGK